MRELGRAAAVVMVATLALAAPPVSAQRRPVLSQVRLPHPYYFRELYLPQLTSGPSAVTWSPDGQEVIYSMRGSLWRQRVGSDEATQLTDGPGYDYQPDWSRDGRYVVFVTYADDQLQLRVLTLSTGEMRTLIADGSVNVEPPSIAPINRPSGFSALRIWISAPGRSLVQSVIDQ